MNLYTYFFLIFCVGQASSCLPPRPSQVKAGISKEEKQQEENILRFSKKIEYNAYFSFLDRDQKAFVKGCLIEIQQQEWRNAFRSFETAFPGMSYYVLQDQPKQIELWYKRIDLFVAWYGFFKKYYISIIVDPFLTFNKQKIFCLNMSSTNFNDFN